MLAEWLLVDWGTVPLVILSTVGVYAVVILLTRLNGLRTFSKMSGFDFAMTVAVGSLMASTMINESPPLLQAAVGLATLYACQRFVAWLRVRYDTRHIVDNEPLLLMKGPEMLEENMKLARVSKADLYGKLREANVLNLAQVRAVVMETSGDISVLHAAGKAELMPELLTGVLGAETGRRA